MLHTIPEHLKLDLISNCNYGCEFCPYHGTGAKDNYNSRLDIDIIRRNIFGNSIFKSVQISGSGESMLHPKFSEIIKFIRARTGTLRIITNGTLLENNLDVVVRNFDNVGVSLHGGKETHESIVRTRGSFKRATAGILALKEAKFDNVKIHYVLTEKNMGDVPFIVEFAKTHNISITFALDFLPNVDRYINLSQKIIETMNYIRAYGFTVNPNLNSMEVIKFYTKKDYIIDPRNCSHVHGAIEVASDGNVNICRSGIFGNVNNTGLDEIIGSSKREHFLREISYELSAGGLSDPRCNRCCYQKVPKENQAS